LFTNAVIAISNVAVEWLYVDMLIHVLMVRSESKLLYQRIYRRPIKCESTPKV
jgi:hypothetical protein